MGDLITEAAHIFFETPNMLPPEKDAMKFR